MERLQKYLAAGGIASRRKSEDIIREGRVKVNGVTVTEMGHLVSSYDDVTVDDIVVTKETKKYYCMYKPRFLLSSATDNLGRPTVITTLPAELKKERLFPVGRLDYDTKGILLLTNDGDFMNNLVGPKSAIEKEYLVRVDGILTPEHLKPIRQGITFEKVTYQPAYPQILSVDSVNSSSLVKIILTEGKYHQVKKMFEAISFPVKRLTRVRFGNIEIGELKEGEIRPLTIHEVKTLFVLSQGGKK